MIYKSWPSFLIQDGSTSSPAANQQVYLASAAPYYGDGSSPVLPLDASTQPKLDAIWARLMPLSTAKNTITFNYAPGLYQTNGPNVDLGPLTVYTGNYHVGAGRDLTTLQLVNASLKTSTGGIFGNGTVIFPQYWVNGWGCSDMTLDCNAVNQPKWTGAGGAVYAISINGGQNITIRNLKVIGFGTVTSGVECFPVGIMSSNKSTPQVMSNILIDSCVFTNPAKGNHDGCSCATITDNNSGNVTADNTCVISNCNFVNCTSDFSFQHCYGAPTCSGNFSSGCDVAFYIEPQQYVYPGITMRVTLNSCINTNRAVYALMHNSSQFLNMLVQGNNFNTKGVSAFQITGSGGTAASINTVTIDSNKFSNSGGTYGVDINENGVSDLVLQNAIVTNNLFSGFAGNSINLDPRTSVIVSRTVNANTIL